MNAFKPASHFGATLLAIVSLTSGVKAGVVVNIVESDGNVFLSGSGTLNVLDLAGVSGMSNVVGPALIGPGHPQLFAAGGSMAALQSISGPSSFGTGGFSAATSSTGDAFGILDATRLLIPVSYVSGGNLTAEATWEDSSLSSLGLTEGTYVWTWGTGANADSLTLNIGVELRITNLSKSGTTVTADLQSNVGNVDVYRSQDLADFGTVPIATGLAPGVGVTIDSEAHARTAFYTLVPTGSSAP